MTEHAHPVAIGGVVNLVHIYAVYEAFMPTNVSLVCESIRRGRRDELFSKGGESMLHFLRPAGTISSGL